MKTMPILVHDDTQGAFTCPIISAAEWWSRLGAICQATQDRPMAVAEVVRANRMSGYNWTLRVVASELFGESDVDAYYRGDL
jgi:hypothetical protein